MVQIQVQSGIFDFEAPRITLGDMAHALSQICRYTGNCDVHWSVAHHTLLCKELAPLFNLDKDLYLPLMLHDGPEYVLQDQNGKWKHNLGTWYHDTEKKIEFAIAKKFGFDISAFSHPKIKTIDEAALYVESKALFNNRSQELWAWLDEKYDSMETLQPIVAMMKDAKLRVLPAWEAASEFRLMIIKEIAG